MVLEGGREIEVSLGLQVKTGYLVEKVLQVDLVRN